MERTEGSELGAADQNNTGEDYLSTFNLQQEWEAFVSELSLRNSSSSNSAGLVEVGNDFGLEQLIEELDAPSPNFWNELEFLSEGAMDGQLEAFPNPNKAECPIYLGGGVVNLVGDLATPPILSGDSGDLTPGDNLLPNPGPLEVEAEAGSTSPPVDKTSDGDAPTDYPQKSGGGGAPPGKGAGEKPYPCASCPKSFFSSGSLNRHNRAKHVGANGPRKCANGTKGSGEKFYQCTSCPNSFSYSSSLHWHVLSKHAGHKSHKCPTCTKSFFHPRELQSHMMTHTGNYSNKCPTCDKGFLNPSSLKVHINTHTGLRPFKCWHCPRDFTQSGHLSRHVRSLHVRQEP